jgi:DNA-binding NarL/FixJ family response regulator
MDDVGVLFVDHRETFRRAARELVGATPGFSWLAEAASAEEAIETALELRPRFVLVEPSLPGIDGLETGRRLRDALPGATVVVLPASGEPDLASLTPGALRALWESRGPD